MKKSIFCDLHMHTTASDGQYSPSQLIQLAAEQGLNVLAITDHDTMDGLDEGITAGKSLGMTVIRGIELSAKGYPSFHILDYNFSPDGEDLKGICREMKEAREQRKYCIMDFLTDKGVSVELSEVEDIAGGVIGKPHFAQVLVRHGYAGSVQDAFDKYLNTPEYKKNVKREKPSAKRCIKAIKQAGGKVSLAHPYQMGIDNAALEELVRELKGYGLDAIELFYPKYTSEMQEFYSYLIDKYDLRATGGSDYHGERVKPDTKLAHLCMGIEWMYG